MSSTDAKHKEVCMEISRRDFIRIATASAAALGLSSLELSKAEQALAAATSPPVLWLSGSSCTGCSVSLLNAVNPTIDQVLTSTISLKYHPTLMAGAGDLAVSAARSAQAAGGYILVVEGAIPTGSSGKYCYVWDEGGQPVTMASAVRSLAANAKYVVAVGACAAYGGIPKASSTTGAQGLGPFLGRSVINLPGCPTHPDWIVGSLVKLLAGTPPSLDTYGRPSIFYPRTIHSTCPRREMDETSTFGRVGCLKELGCRGPETYADCVSRKWNNGQSWCVNVNGPCWGCTQPFFPAFPLHRNDD
jgi:hydrogenase small subunit